MKFDMRLQVLVVVVALPVGVLSAYAVSDGPADTLAAPESFAAISDTASRSAALFAEVGKVLTNPRCVNCHPAGDRPRQADVGPSTGKAEPSRRERCAAVLNPTLKPVKGNRPKQKGQQGFERPYAGGMTSNRQWSWVPSAWQ
jgi:hypothetical protein